MAGNDGQIDAGRTYFVKGKTLQRIVDMVVSLENLKIIWGPGTSVPSISWGKRQSILTIPQWQGGAGGAGPQFGYPFQVTINEDGDAVIDSGTASYLHKSYDAADSQSVTNLNTPFTLGTTTHAWIEITVDSSLDVTAAALLTGSSFPDLIEDDAGMPPEQTKYNLPVGRIVSGAQPGMPGFDITISDDPYHWQQLLREHQILLARCFNGTPCLVASPWQGV